MAAFSSFIISSKVVINGVTYIRSRDAARAVNLALDYVSRLARHGVISGKRVSGIWFVDPKSLQKFIVEQERQKKIATRTLRTDASRRATPCRTPGRHRLPPAANDNVPVAANDNSPITPSSATGTDATTTATFR